MAGNVAEFDDGTRNLSGLARIFRKDRKTIKRYIDEFGVRPEGEVNGALVYSVLEVGRALLVPSKTDGKDGEIDPSQLSPNEQRAYFQARNEEVEYLRSLGELIPATEFRKALSDAFKALSQTMGLMGDRMERDFGIPPEIVEKIQDAMEHLQTELAERVEKLSAEQSDDS